MKYIRAHLLSLVLVVGGAAAHAQSPSITPSGEQFAYVFSCAGQYIKIDLQAGTYSQPVDTPGIASGSGGFDGCLIKSFALNLPQSILYAIMPASRFVDPFGQRQDKVVALRLPDLRVVNTITMPVSNDLVPKIRQNTTAHELSVTYRTPQLSSTSSGNIVEYILSTEDPEALIFKKHPVVPEAETAVRHQILSSTAHIDDSGKIIDGDRVIDTNGAVSSVNGYTLLTDSMRRQFKSLRRTGVNGQYLDVVFADSAAGRMLFIVSWDSMNNRSAVGGGFIVYDAVNSKIVSSALIPYREAAFELIPGTPTVHLTPDGKVVVVEEYQWQEAASFQQRLKTGALALYDALSGNAVGTLQLTPAPGNSGRLVGFSGDSNFLYYASGQTMYVIDLSLKMQTLLFKLPQGFSPANVVTFR